VTVTDQEHAGVMANPTPEPGTPAEPIVRPAAPRWIWYALGGGLPERNRGWVLHDTTTGTWWLRHLARALVQLAVPIALVLLLVPGPFWIRGMAALGGLILGLIFSLAYMTETTENRVVRAGYRVGAAQAARERSAMHRHEQETVRRREAAAKRAARYRARTGR
jgi:Family of unknown function (DUF5313)